MTREEEIASEKAFVETMKKLGAKQNDSELYCLGARYIFEGSVEGDSYRIPYKYYLLTDGKFIHVFDMSTTPPRYVGVADNWNKTEELIRRDLFERYDGGWTLLHEAAARNDLKLLRFLVETVGYDPNTKDYYGTVPLHAAAENGSYDAAKYLLEHGADVNITNDDHKTPLDYAIYAMSFALEMEDQNEDAKYHQEYQNAKRTAELLLQHGAKTNRVSIYCAEDWESDYKYYNEHLYSWLREHGLPNPCEENSEEDPDPY